MKKAIVITSIYPPTDAIRTFSKMEDHLIIVAGDKKTTPDWNCGGVFFLSIEKQLEIARDFANSLPVNHYSRKMMGYLHAFKQGCDIIIDLDDDIYPKADWGFPPWEGLFPQTKTNKGFINIYQYFTSQKIWPRGLPLNIVDHHFEYSKSVNREHCKIGIWQGLSDENPDVDAIYRLTNNESCIFEIKEPLILAEHTICPSNSQNTAFRKELFELLYLPTTVGFRFTDILRSLVAQPIMWLYGYQLGFTHATTVQRRNPHDLMEDFRSEVSMYLHAPRVVEVITKVLSSQESVAANLFNAYKSLEKEKIITSKEMPVLETWLRQF